MRKRFKGSCDPNASTSASTSHYESIFPDAVLLRIFGFTDTRTLVFDCRRVCKLWKSLIESANTWKLQIRRLAVRNNELASILPTAHYVYPWYICYAICKNIFGTNLIVGSFPETRGYSNRTTYYSPFGAFLMGFSQLPQELLDEGANFCFFAADGETIITYIIDLYQRGFTKKVLEMRPPIDIKVWCNICDDFDGSLSLIVRLLNSQRDVVENGTFWEDIVTERTDWHNMTHTFTNYSTDIRYVKLESSIEILFPSVMVDYGNINFLDGVAKVTAAKIIINLPDISYTTIHH